MRMRYPNTKIAFPHAGIGGSSPSVRVHYPNQSIGGCLARTAPGMLNSHPNSGDPGVRGMQVKKKWKEPGARKKMKIRRYQIMIVTLIFSPTLALYTQENQRSKIDSLG